MPVSIKNLAVLAIGFAAGSIGGYLLLGGNWIEGAVAGTIAGFLYSAYDSYKKGPQVKPFAFDQERDK